MDDERKVKELYKALDALHAEYQQKVNRTPSPESKIIGSSDWNYQGVSVGCLLAAQKLHDASAVDGERADDACGSGSREEEVVHPVVEERVRPAVGAGHVGHCLPDEQEAEAEGDERKCANRPRRDLGHGEEP